MINTGKLTFHQNIATYNIQDPVVNNFTSQKELMLTNFAEDADTNIMGMY